MKQILTSLLLASSLTNGQVPPVPPSQSTQPPLAASATAAASTSAPAASATPTTTAGLATTAPMTTAAATTGAATTAAATTAAATTAAGTTGAATTAAATTAAPVTTAAGTVGATPTEPATTIPPTKPPVYINPYCPAGLALEALGAPNNPTLPYGYTLDQNAECRSNIPGDPRSVANDFEGRLLCNNFACCLCQEINCGSSGWGCEQLKIGDSGAVGVQNINVIGTPSTAVWTGFGWTDGAQVDCSGLESCKRSKIRGKYVGKMECSGDFGCEGADISYTAANGANFQCNGAFTCARSKIEIIADVNTYELGTIEFNGQQAGQGAEVIIRNIGPNQLHVQNFECMNPQACVNLRIQIIGNVWFENCDLQGMQNLNSLPPLLQACALGQSGSFGTGVFPQQTPVVPGLGGSYPHYPQYPQYGYPGIATVAPVTTAAPQLVNPAPPQSAGTPSGTTPSATTPSATTPSATTPSTGGAAPSAPRGTPLSLVGQSLKCSLPGQCGNRDIAISASNNFVFECLFNCNLMKLKINAGLDPMNPGHIVERIDSLKFIGANSGANAEIIVNTLPGHFLEINDIRCEGFGSCRGLKVIVGAGVNVYDLNMDCQQPGSCAGCTVEQNGVSTSCELLHHQGGNFGFGGNFAFPQQLPGTPQHYPNYPQHQQYPGYSPYPHPQFI